MMMANLINAVILGLSCAEAFTQLSKAHLQNTRNGVVFSTGIGQKDEGQSILEEARKIAWSNDELLILDAELYLNHVLALEQDCSSGDGQDDVCEIVDSPMMEEVRKCEADVIKLKRWSYIGCKAVEAQNGSSTSYSPKVLVGQRWNLPCNGNSHLVINTLDAIQTWNAVYI